MSADFQEAEDFTQNNEDASHAHAIVPDAPAGAHAISGINSVAFPTEYAAIAAIPQTERGPAVDAFYKEHFWNRWEGMLPGVVADRVFDAAVNMGPGTAVRLLQSAINSLGGNVVVDGGWGPATVNAANALDPAALEQAFKDQRVTHYKAIVAAHPEDSQYEANWLARAEK